jgi:regulator of sigma E protease
VPLGGFVQLGEDDEAGDDPNHFNNKKIWERAAILSAGVAMNIVLAAILISIGFMIGMPQSLDGVSKRAEINDRKIQILAVSENSPAGNAGVVAGDIIIAIDDYNFDNYAALQDFVDENQGKDLNYKLKRSDKDVEVVIRPELMSDTGRGGIGVAIMEVGIVKFPFFLSIWEGIKTTIFLTWMIILAFFGLLKGLLTGAALSAGVAGPVGIATLTGQAARMGISYLIQFTALLSINLAIINFLPFPALDGGRVFFLIIEKIKGSPVKKEIEGAMHYIGFALLMILVLVVTFKDIAKFSGSFKAIFEKIIN